jgi:hypothetical protein
LSVSSTYVVFLIYNSYFFFQRIKLRSLRNCMEYLRKAKVALLLSLSYISSLVTFTEDGATRNGSSGFCS